MEPEPLGNYSTPKIVDDAPADDEFTEAMQAVETGDPTSEDCASE